ncbi:MAG TPA: ABC transporter substrate-binding protein [Thermoguttaceae bacterium]|nr:ABC transporter substrate-binding protein [Thermoguttaceae bacterium]
MSTKPSHLLTLVILALTTSVLPAAPPSQRKAAFLDLRIHQPKYVGPGRELPEPTDVDEVLLGYFGPDDPADPRFGQMWCAARLAVEEANRQGGYRGKNFRLLAGWSKDPWGTGVAQVARMVYRDKVWAIIGGVDGASTHLAEQIVAKARLPLISPGCTDKTVNLVNLPWMFSCMPADPPQARVLADAIRQRIGKRPFVLVAGADHDSRLFVVELEKQFTDRQLAPSFQFAMAAASPTVNPLVGRIVATNADAVVLIAGPEDSARLVRQLREADFKGTLFGGPAMGHHRFLQEAQQTAEGALFPLLYSPGEASEDFEKAFRERYGAAPDYTAAYTYDAVRLTIHAVRQAGLNRTRIGDTLRDLSPWPGVTGPMTWNATGSNTRAVDLGTVRNAQVQSMH